MDSTSATSSTSTASTGPVAEPPALNALIRSWAIAAGPFNGLHLAAIGPDDEQTEIVAAGHVDPDVMAEAVTELAAYADWPDLLPVPAPGHRYAVVERGPNPACPDELPEDDLIVYTDSPDTPGAQPITVVDRPQPAPVRLVEGPDAAAPGLPADGGQAVVSGRITALHWQHNATGAPWVFGVLMLPTGLRLQVCVFPQKYAGVRDTVVVGASVELAGRMDRRDLVSQLIVHTATATATAAATTTGAGR